MERKKDRTGNDTGGWEVGSFALYDGLFYFFLIDIIIHDYKSDSFKKMKDFITSPKNTFLI